MYYLVLILKFQNKIVFEELKEEKNQVSEDMIRKINLTLEEELHFFR